MIKLTNITKTFSWNKDIKTNILYSGLNFEVATGEFISILWRSGCGKTTLLNMISWLVDFNSGEVTVKDTNFSTLSQEEITTFRGKNMSFIFQQFHLIPNLTVSENIELPLDINKTKRRFSTKEILKKVWIKIKHFL